MSKIDMMSLRKLSNGLFAVFTNDGTKHNACIINTAQQITDTPTLITVCINQSSYTCETIKKTKEFNLSILSEEAPFKLFSALGFVSGRDTDKLKDCTALGTSENGLKYLTKFSNSYLSAKVIDMTDYGTHTIFVAEVTEAAVLSDVPSATYAYYFTNIKPQPKNASSGKSKKIVGWRCIICGYEYEGAELPSDYTCPLCAHPATDFEPIYEDGSAGDAAEESKDEEKKNIVGWRCIICGYEYEGAELPSDYVCPLCNHPASDFEPIYG